MYRTEILKNKCHSSSEIKLSYIIKNTLGMRIWIVSKSYAVAWTSLQHLRIPGHKCLLATVQSTVLTNSDVPYWARRSKLETLPLFNRTQHPDSSIFLDLPFRTNKERVFFSEITVQKSGSCLLREALLHFQHTQNHSRTYVIDMSFPTNKTCYTAVLSHTVGQLCVLILVFLSL
jgi:hypothetical protein